jgi:hypothetical protein
MYPRLCSVRRAGERSRGGGIKSLATEICKQDVELLHWLRKVEVTQLRAGSVANLLRSATILFSQFSQVAASVVQWSELLATDIEVRVRFSEK